jgi:hypothetical protein
MSADEPWYRNTTAGFTAKLSNAQPGDDKPAQPSSPSRGPVTTGVLSERFKASMYPNGYVSGLGLAQSTVLRWGNVAGDVAMLYREFIQAHKGAASNYAEGRLAGYLAQLQEVFDALRERGVEVKFPIFDEVELIGRLKYPGVPQPCLSPFPAK